MVEEEQEPQQDWTSVWKYIGISAGILVIIVAFVVMGLALRGRMK